jgi:hypothetical protein
MVEELFSDFSIYSQDCIALQEELNGTCCGDEVDTGNSSTTGSPPGGDFPPCSMCYDGSFPSYGYVIWLLPHMNEISIFSLYSLPINFDFYVSSTIAFTASDGTQISCAELENSAAAGAVDLELCAIIAKFDDQCGCPTRPDILSTCSICPSTGVQNPNVVFIVPNLIVLCATSNLHGFLLENFFGTVVPLVTFMLACCFAIIADLLLQG